MPLLALLLLLAGAAAYFGPGIYRGVLFRRQCRAMLEDARAGRTSAVAGYVEASQQKRIATLLSQHLPAGYHEDIRSLRLLSSLRDDSTTMWAIVGCRIERNGYAGFYQGKLLWRYELGRWWWDFEGSYAAEWGLTGEPDWVKLAELIVLAEKY